MSSDEDVNDNQSRFFPTKLWCIIHSNTTGSIRWDPSGKIIYIDSRLFEAEYLGRNFRTRKFSSFKRVLYSYGFRKVRDGGPAYLEKYYHPKFQRGRMDLLSQVKCRRSLENRPEEENRLNYRKMTTIFCFFVVLAGLSLFYLRL